MASDVSQQITTDLQKAACYSMCLDESTDVNNHARLAVILRYAVCGHYERRAGEIVIFD